MEIIEITDPTKHNDFSVRKFIKEGETHYVEIRPGQKSYRIRISPSDYHNALQAYYSSKTIICFPLEGNPENGIFEDVVYELIIK